MGRKRGLTLDQIIAAAAEVADGDGSDALNLAAVADTLGVRSPSLYNHVDGLAGLRRQLALDSSRMLTAQLASAVADSAAPADALRAIAVTYRQFALSHPGRYGVLLPAPTPEQDPELAAALAESVSVVVSVLAEQGLEEETMIPLIRALRASVHGFVHLELSGGFGLPDSIDDSFTDMVDLVVAAIVARSGAGAMS